MAIDFKVYSERNVGYKVSGVGRVSKEASIDQCSREIQGESDLGYMGEESTLSILGKEER
jgi:hypothetical protein